ncbi:hypothetical protein CCZ01_08115 [Helicobacter monodelphidis]|uniref:radical SAM/SPASM domain-containing protein n=1 Tax=Helicobacter sp. 15-1451 TaxID=2004995 RepID=UPI000DCE6AF0|nr:radical SAM protein [Helicobacter sp. 15-1451]RAX56895.1 hypothetical protein CCZ01_08115 [Helicobacter sp. 15-1451]
MKQIFVKFKNPPTQGDKDILANMGIKADIFFAPTFYSQQFFSLLRDNFSCSKTSGGGASIVGFSVELEKYCGEFSQILSVDDNCYTQFCNPYESLDDPLLFNLFHVDGLEKFSIEYALREHLISKEMRNILHTQVTQMMHTKQHYYEDRRLLNLSSSWKSVQKIQAIQYPKTIYIGLLNQCNASCPHCAWFGTAYRLVQTNSYFKEHKTLDTKYVMNILDYAKKAQAKLIFSGPGEPLLDSRLLDFVSLAKAKQIPCIQLATNGILLQKNLCEQLIWSGISCFDVSILFADDVYRDEEELNSLKNNLRQLALLIQENNSLEIGAKISIVYEQKFAIDAFRFFIEIKEKYPFIVCSLSPYNFVLSEEFTISNKRHTCSAPFASLYVFPDGSVGLCERQREMLGREDVKNFRLGYLSEQTLDEIWNNITHRHFMDKHQCLDFELECFNPCRNCNSWWNEVE